MVQDQLVDYISSQMKLGVSEDAIKATLVGAGWAVTDVEDTLKKTKAPVVTPQPARPVMASPTTTTSFSVTTVSPMMAKGKSPDPQVIRVSDLVSASSPSAVSSVGVSVSQQKTSPSSKNVTKPSSMVTMTQTPSGTKSSGKGLIVTVILVVLVVIFAGLAGYFFFQNMGLTANVGTVNVQTQTVTSQISALQAQIQAENVSSTAMNVQLTSLTANNQELQTDLSLFVVPTGNVTTTEITIMGSVSGGKPTYIITTVNGAKASVKNSADANIQALLQPLVNTATTVKIIGTHVPGSSIITVLSINGISVIPLPSPPATTTAAITPTGTATTTTGL